MKKIIIILISALCIGLLIYHFQSSEPPQPPIPFDSAYLNQQIRLIAPQGLNSYKIGDLVGILLEYDTSNKIVFPNNYNLRLFTLIDNQWIEIWEKPTERLPDKIVLSPETSSSYNQIIGFIPSINDRTKIYNIRLYIFGDMLTPDGVKKVAGFVDFILTP